MYLPETHGILKTMHAIQYNRYKWDIRGDLKVVALLLGLQIGYAKYMCFVRLWDSRADKEHYTRVN